MKGYRRKDEALTSANSNNRDSGIFTGINGDANSLVDEEFDYKKHTVKDLAAHFALVKPKQNIPTNILPEQRMFNGGQAPQLNYLGANEAGATVTSQQSSRREVSQQDIEASKQAYEMKKKQQMEAQQSGKVTTTTTDSSSVMRRTQETSSSSEQKSERRMSLRDSLMLDPAKAHADAGLIDPSAILRGEAVIHWKSSDPSHTQLSLGAISSSPSNPMYISRKDPSTRSFAPVKFSTLPRGSSSNSSSSSSLGQISKSHLPPLPPSNSFSKPPSSHTNISLSEQNQMNPTPNLLINTHSQASSSSSVSKTKVSTNPLIVLESSSPGPSPQPSTLHRDTVPLNTQQNVSEKKSVIQNMLINTGTGPSDPGYDELAVSLSVPDCVSRSSAPTPCPTTPFPGLDTQPSGLTIPSSPNLGLRPRTPILVTTRPSSVCLDRTRHVSKDDIAKMMAELNEPLPPMLDIPTEIRASPLIFSGGLAAVPSHPHPQSSPHPHSSLALSSTTIMSPSSTVRNQ